jgi:signal transduction histidine kinase
VADQAIKTSLTGLLGAAQDAETAQRGFMLTNDEQYLEPYHIARVDMPRYLADLERMASNHPDVQARLPELKGIAAERMGLVERSVAFMKAGDRQASLDQLNSGLGKTIMDRLRAITSELSARQDTVIKEGQENLDRSQGWGLFVKLATIALIVALALTTAGIINRFVRDLESAQTELQTVNAGLERIVDERTGDILRANEEIQRFAYIVSHDLRAPLVNIMGFTSELEAIGKMVSRQYEAVAERAPDLMLADTPEAVNNDLPEAIGFIRNSTAKMDRLINAILGLSREGRRVLTPVSVDMTTLVSEIAGSLKHQVDAAGGEIVVGKLPTLLTDKLAIEQVFSNLIENAVKYVDQNRPPLVEIAGYKEGSQCRFEIKDNGRGIEEKDLERVFELFRRAGRQDRPGEGLGLAFVRAAVRRLGGTISIKSEFGKGTTFSLKFPEKMQLSRSNTHG